MGWLTKQLSPEDPSAPLLPGSWLMESLGIGQGNDSGIAISEKGAMRISAVLACVRVISETIGTLPLNVYQWTANGKRLAPEHPLSPVLGNRWNGQMSSYVAKVAVQAQSCLWGNGYAEIQRDGAYRSRGLWPLPSDRTRPRRINGALQYVTTATTDGRERLIAPENIIHMPFLSFDGLQGFSPIQLMRQGLGLNAAAERFGSMLFGRGSRPSGILTHPGSLKAEARANMKASWQESTSGANAMSVPIMEEGVTFQALTINPTDAQFLETRKFQKEEVASWYRVPPHMIGLLDRAQHSNIEQQTIDFSQFTMLPWVTLWEEELNYKLFAGTNFYAKFDMDGLLRGDFLTRMQGLNLMRLAGVLSANDINDKQDWPRIPEEQGGDVRIVPLNFVSLETVKINEEALGDPPETDEGEPGEGADPQPNEDGENASVLRQRFSRAFLRLFQDATGRTINREKRDAAFVQRVWLPTLTALADSMSATNGSKELPAEVHTFLKGYAGAVADRSKTWKKPDSETLAKAEFDRAYTAFAEQIMGCL
jgi:HK97 family phage portal protein